MVQLLLESKADVNTQGGEYGNALGAAEALLSGYEIYHGKSDYTREIAETNIRGRGHFKRFSCIGRFNKERPIIARSISSNSTISYSIEQVVRSLRT